MPGIGNMSNSNALLSNCARNASKIRSLRFKCRWIQEMAWQAGKRISASQFGSGSQSGGNATSEWPATVGNGPWTVNSVIFLCDLWTL
jgi:hypothetical protein